MEERKREALVEMLKNQSLVVHFTKLNGDKRVMTCTLQEDMLPPAKKRSTVDTKENPCYKQRSNDSMGH